MKPRIGQWVWIDGERLGRVFGIWPKRFTAAVGTKWEPHPCTGEYRIVEAEMAPWCLLSPAERSEATPPFRA